MRPSKESCPTGCDSRSTLEAAIGYLWARRENGKIVASRENKIKSQWETDDDGTEAQIW